MAASSRRAQWSENSINVGFICHSDRWLAELNGRKTMDDSIINPYSARLATWKIGNHHENVEYFPGIDGSLGGGDGIGRARVVLLQAVCH